MRATGRTLVFLILVTPGIVVSTAAQRVVRLDDKEALRVLAARSPLVRSRWRLEVEHTVTRKPPADFAATRRSKFQGELQVSDRADSLGQGREVIGAAHGSFSWEDDAASGCEDYRGGPLSLDLTIQGVATRGSSSQLVLRFDGTLQDHGRRLRRAYYTVPCREGQRGTLRSLERVALPAYPAFVKLPQQEGVYVLSEPSGAPGETVETRFRLTTECVVVPEPEPNLTVSLHSPVAQRRLHHDRSAKEIQAMSLRQNSVGLTNLVLDMQVSQSVGSARVKGKSCVWLSGVAVTLHHSAVDVYVAREYKKDSCEYQAVLDHEGEHIRVSQRLLEEYAGRMKKALLGHKFPSYADPLWVSSFEDGRKKIEAEVGSLLDPLYAELRVRQKEANAAVDAADSGYGIKDRCPAEPKELPPARRPHAP